MVAQVFSIFLLTTEPELSAKDNAITALQTTLFFAKSDENIRTLQTSLDQRLPKPHLEVPKKTVIRLIELAASTDNNVVQTLLKRYPDHMRKFWSTCWDALGLELFGDFF